MTQEILMREMLSEMRACIGKEAVKAGLPFEADEALDIEHIFVLWQQFTNSIENLKRYISRLDDDIAARVPWGDVCTDSAEGFDENLPVTRFWTAPKDCFSVNYSLWAEQFGASLVSEGEFLSYFITSTPRGEDVTMEGAEEASVCPSPASTLIMLQTRAKDTLKSEQQKQADFAVEHYREVESALGLKNTIPQNKRKRLLFKLKRIPQLFSRKKWNKQ